MSFTFPHYSHATSHDPEDKEKERRGETTKRVSTEKKKGGRREGGVGERRKREEEVGGRSKLPNSANRLAISSARWFA